MASNARDASPADEEQFDEMEARERQERLDAYIAEELELLDKQNLAFNEEYAKLIATQRLESLRFAEYIEANKEADKAKQRAKKAAKALEAAVAAQQLAAQQLAEQQKPNKPQKQPSKKQTSTSKNKDPSPSSVIDADLGPDDPDDADMTLALLRSLEDDQDEGREATEKPFEEWINEFSELHPARAKLYNLFNGGRWSVVNPRGDGFCGLYVAAIDFQNNHAPNTDPMLLAQVHAVSRDGLIELIIDGMKKYYEARNKHNELGIRIPSELGENKIINVDDSDRSSYFELTEDLLLTNEEFIREKLRILGRLANTPEALFVFLPYIYKRSYLILSYDVLSNTPFLTTYMPCYADVEKDARNNVIYPYDGVTNTAIMFNNGHYFLLYNTDPETREYVINRLLANKISDEPIRDWQEGVVAEGRRLRKRKVGTQKGRTKKVITKKMRPHRSLRRKHKPKTHTIKKQ
jgi:hypothetical protein